ncbi:MAG TPA: amidohydrolase family protein [Chthoniobacteraceae bacterium]|nr:amidohydrolase family protein [Chthoniobacteraceae bacterium]
MIVDAHIHFEALEVYDRQLADLEYGGADQFCVLVMDRLGNAPDAFRQAQGIWMKSQNPGRAFLFGGIDWEGVFDKGREVPDLPLVPQAQRLQALGFDGLKLITGKPGPRRTLGVALDGAAMRPLLEWLEESRFPVLWHVGDPPEFWSEATAPEWARPKGWWYDESYPSKAMIDAEMERVLQRHPRLNLILPHFFFLADRLEEAAAFLERHPAVSIDLAPGVEWMHHLSANREAGREFFVRHSRRIIYGSDLGMLHNATHRDRAPTLRRFLETGEVIALPPDPFMVPDDRPDLCGLALPPEVLREIYAANFHRIIGRVVPRPLEREGIAAYLRELAAQEAAAGGEGGDAGRIARALGT